MPIPAGIVHMPCADWTEECVKSTATRAHYYDLFLSKSYSKCPELDALWGTDLCSEYNLHAGTIFQRQYVRIGWFWSFSCAWLLHELKIWEFISHISNLHADTWTVVLILAEWYWNKEFRAAVSDAMTWQELFYEPAQCSHHLCTTCPVLLPYTLERTHKMMNSASQYWTIIVNSSDVVLATHRKFDKVILLCTTTPCTVIWLLLHWLVSAALIMILGK